jgi:oligo-1,6-glucosidase
MEQHWWQHTNIYQVYLRSFYDSNHDGIGDIQGVIRKLDYLKSLGIGVIWISPHYASPMDDNGYDVSDFYQVSPDYGTIDDFKELLDKAHSMGIKVITDLILNHTSDEHPWFVAASNPNHPEYHKYHDYYIWQPPKIDEQGQIKRPTRWMGWFGSPAWTYNEATNEYYLHIFSKKMPDLNWRNASMRQEMKEMIRYWIQLGVDGFRVDASNHLEKNWEFPDDFPGYHHFSSLPKHHEYLQELGSDIFVPMDLLTIGESGGASKEEALQYAGYGSNEFNMLIQFGHCWADVDDSNSVLMGKWAQGKLRLSSIKESFKNWYEMLENVGWNVIYWHNHDQPRIVSHYGNDSTYWFESACMLAVALYLMPGTAICYQGEEIGMTNVDYQELSMFKDVEVFTEYQNMVTKGLSHEHAMNVIRARCRDNARSPMQWSEEAHGGFSIVTPWMPSNGNYLSINVKNQLNQPTSILSLYQQLLNQRLSNANITHGKITFLDVSSQKDFSYLNTGTTEEYLVLCNFTSSKIIKSLKGLDVAKYTLIYNNYFTLQNLENEQELFPYESQVWKRVISQ